MAVREEGSVRFVAGRVRRALERTRVSVTARAYRHLVGVLCLPISDAWFATAGIHEPLTQWYRRGVSQPVGSPDRAYILGYVGDATLLAHGFWWERHVLRGAPPSVEELAELGRRAYRNIDEEPYRELADKYQRLADAMAVLAAHYTAGRDGRVVALCESVRLHHDRRSIRILKHLGIPAALADPGIPS